ncbi:hypothetical protein KY389_00195 [Paracoccus bogoriensis]|uniref:hypothetical protein n=1 Tax=Paracoccus bogoriensis TaxID=242065 RepID=UPI001CA5E09D|nr:hypothetical protein [Paracoccus bogoriensis]MBW7055110.1 hypothetical protein [Paracoccus bogoriensis]
MDRTRVVRSLRVILPLAALAMLSTLFLFSRGSETESRIPYAQVDAEAMARDPRLVAPEYAAVTEDGTRISLMASTARPDGERAEAEALRLDWQRPDGLGAMLVAPNGGLADGRIRLDGGVRMTTSTGWQMDAPRIDAATDRSEIIADDGIEAKAPFGRISAGRMRLEPGDDGETGAAVLNFSGGVRLIYQP